MKADSANRILCNNTADLVIGSDVSGSMEGFVGSYDLSAADIMISYPQYLLGYKP